METWERIFTKHGKFFVSPHPDISSVARLLKKRGLTRVLDLGCGTGRHLVYLARRGFDAYGCDASRAGLLQAYEWLRRENLRARLRKTDIYKEWPYKDNFFEAVISVQVIHHGTPERILFLISEMERTLTEEGIIFITVPRPRQKIRNPSRLESRVIVPEEGLEKGLPHFYFNRRLLKKFFRNFTIEDIHVDRFNHYCLTGRKKVRSCP